MGDLRIVIAASGSQSKWGHHLGVPSHLVRCRDGRPLLARTIAQARAVTGDVHVTVPPGDPRYRLPGAAWHPRPVDLPSEYAATRDLWNPGGRTVLLLGDVYFTDEAFSRIVSCPDRHYRVFGRYGSSAVTGSPHGEIFAISWWWWHHEWLDAHLRVVHATRAAGVVTRPPGWMLLRSIQGTPLGRHLVVRPPFVDIDDATDDLDRPEDWRRHPAFGGGDGG